ncbi:aromatic compound monooxygenase YhjG [Janthinobacterium sp. HH01]|uniref:FAD-dependent monooxygenase n=1 Tax=Janthinobacterium sp. HH01 TaxID=1198452 RepID=UPI0002AEDFC9|nr:FAD-dependent monooxygenase [Janthinobacterium sp. HH01]ELX11112.1 aromatic compound monooxygenase YhjG [Janthinobacterium sp. HH01]
MKSDTDVIIVGAGPVGLLLACELRLAGADVVLLERRDKPVRDSRALSMHSRTVETLGLRGLAARFLERGRPFGVGHYGALETMLNFSALDSGYPFQLVIPQSLTEQLLEERARELGVHLHRGATVDETWQDDAGVHASGTVDLQRFIVNGAYLVGCDGARSAVRRQAGIAFDGVDASTTTILGDVQLRAPLPAPALMKTNQEGVLMIVPLSDGVHHRLIVLDARRRHLPVTEPVTLEELADGARRIAGCDYLPSQPRWLSRFSDETRHAAQYRQGRIFLAGDAAHIHMPAGGQGMNVGMQDAFNLGWKMAAVVQGQAPQALLDSYHDERHPLGAELFRNTMAQTALMTSLDRRGLALRAEISGLLTQPQANLKLALQISGLGIGYGAPLSVPPAPVMPGWSGRRIPEMTLAGGGSLHGLLHDGQWLYLRLREDAPPAVACPGRLRTVSTALAPLPDPGASQAELVAAGPRALLIRPDGYADYVLA